METEGIDDGARAATDIRQYRSWKEWMGAKTGARVNSKREAASKVGLEFKFADVPISLPRDLDDGLSRVQHDCLQFP